MLPQYTLALGKTEAVEKIMNFIDEQQSIKDEIVRKTKDTPFQVGGDDTFATERKAGE